MKHSCVLFATVLATVVVFAANTREGVSDNRRDGNWWTTKDTLSKLNYTTGFFDGMELGHNMSAWAFLKDKAESQCVNLTIESYANYKSTYLNNVTNGQLVYGIDVFYSDYRNRRIRTDAAVWLVLNSIAGTPQDKLDKMIESYRKNSAD